MARLILLAGLILQGQPPQPMIVKIIEPPGDPTGLRDVLVGALGLSGVIAIGALLLGLLVAGILFLARSRRPLDHSSGGASEVTR